MKKLFFTSLMIFTCLTVGARTTKTYTEDLYVTVNGSTTGPMESPVIITYKNDSTICLALNNFILPNGDDPMYVGNIVIDSVPLTGDGCYQYKKFVYNDKIEITDGTEPAEAPYWLGPMLGELPLNATGKINDNQLYVEINLNLEGTGVINVKLGDITYFNNLDRRGKGDVNGDNSVDIADINAVLKIMNE